jgi:hypothetical protein
VAAKAQPDRQVLEIEPVADQRQRLRQASVPVAARAAYFFSKCERA